MDKIDGAKADGSGNYKRQIIRVTSRGGPVDAITYVGTAVGRKKFVSKTMPEKQVSHDYFGNLEAGAKKFRLPKEYKSYLREHAGDLRE